MNKKTQIGELSGGQKKRIFIARTLAQNAKIILLDEPFTGIDVNTENAIIDIVKDLKKQGCLILISTHNLGSIPNFCNKVLLINKTIIATGATETTFTQENLQKTFGGMLRNTNLASGDLHKDKDSRQINVITDDEQPLIFYGEQSKQNIIKKNKKTKK